MTPAQRAALQVAGFEAQRAGRLWSNNPHKSGSLEAGEWDKGHTVGRQLAAIETRLSTIRAAIEAESASYGQIADLQAIAADYPHLVKGDSLLSEWAGLPENEEPAPLPAAPADMESRALAMIEEPAPVASNELVNAANAIIRARDFWAENGKYNPRDFAPGADQEFDDWAADILQTALAAQTPAQAPATAESILRAAIADALDEGKSTSVYELRATLRAGLNAAQESHQ